jgi:hypothetical protein
MVLSIRGFSRSALPSINHYTWCISDLTLADVNFFQRKDLTLEKKKKKKNYRSVRNRYRRSSRGHPHGSPFCENGCPKVQKLTTFDKTQIAA